MATCALTLRCRGEEEEAPITPPPRRAGVPATSPVVGWRCASLLLLLLVATTPPASATIAITSEFVNLYVENSTIFRQRTITFECSQTSFNTNSTLQVTNSEGVVTNITIECTAPVLDFYLEIVGYVPPDCSPFFQQVCLMHDTSGLVQSVDDDEPLMSMPDLEPMAEHMVRKYHSQRWRKGRSGGRSPSRFARPRKSPHSGRTTVGDASSSGAGEGRISTAAVGNGGDEAGPPHFKVSSWGSFAKGIACAFKGCDPDEKWRKPFKKMKKRLAGLENLVNDEIDKMYYQYNTMVNATNAIVENAQAQALQLNLHNELIENQAAIIQSMNATIIENALYAQQITTGFGKSIDNLRGDVTTLQNNLNETHAQILALAGSVDEDLEDIIEKMNNETRSLSEHFSDGLERNWERGTRLWLYMQSVNAAVSESFQLIRREITWDLYKRELTKLVRAAASEVSELGPDFEPLFESIGAAPANPVTDDLVWRTRIDVLRIFHASDASLTPGGVMQAMEHRFDLYCDTEMLVSTRPTVTTWQEVLDNIGPYDCNSAAWDTATCACWVTYRRYFCNTTEALLNSTDFSSPADSFEPLTSRTAVCTGGVVSSSSVSTFTSPNDVVNQLGAVCDYAVPPSGVHTGYIVHSAMNARAFSAGYSAEFCASASDLIADALEPSSRATTTIVYTFSYLFFNLIDQAFEIIEKAYPELQAKVDGDLPQLLAFQFQPMVRVYSSELGDIETAFPTNASNNRREGRCLTSAFVACVTDPEQMLPVYKVYYTGARTSVRVFYAGETHVYTTSVEFSDGGARVTPSDVYVIGDVTSTVRLYDVPYNELSVGKTPLRVNKITYLMVPPNATDPNTPEPLTALSWFAREETRLNHLSALVTASAYEVDKLPNGTCASSQREALHGSLCRFHDAYNVSSSIEIEFEGVTTAARYFNATPRAVSPYTSKIKATVVVPEGLLTNAFVSACPLTDVQQWGDNAMIATLSNPQGSAGEMVYKIERFGDCCNTTVEGGIESGQSAQHSFLLCLNTDPGCTTGNPHIVVRRLAFTPAASYEFCSNFSIAIDPESFLTRTNITTVRTVDFRAVSQNDATYDGTLLAEQFLFDQLMSFMRIIVDSFAETQLPTSENFVSNVTDWMLRFSGISRNQSEQVLASRNRTDFNWVAGLETYNVSLEARLSDIDDLFNNHLQLMNASTENLKRVNSTGELLNVAIAAYQNASLLLLEAQVLRLNTTQLLFRDMADTMQAIGETAEAASAGWSIGGDLAAIAGGSAIGNIGLVGNIVGNLISTGGKLPIVGTALKIGDKVIDIGEDAVKAVGNAGKYMVDKIDAQIDKRLNDASNLFKGGLGSIIQTVVTLAVGILVIGGVSFVVYKLVRSGACSGKKKEELKMDGMSRDQTQQLETWMRQLVREELASKGLSAPTAAMAQPIRTGSNPAEEEEDKAQKKKEARSFFGRLFAGFGRGQGAARRTDDIEMMPEDDEEGEHLTASPPAEKQKKTNNFSIDMESGSDPGSDE